MRSAGAANLLLYDLFSATPTRLRLYDDAKYYTQFDGKGLTYTITNGEHVVLWELVREVLRRLGYTHRLRSLPYPVVAALAAGLELKATLLGGEPLLTRYTTAILAKTQTYDIDAARRDLGYQPRVSVAEGVERTLATLQSGQHGTATAHG